MNFECKIIVLVALFTIYVFFFLMKIDTISLISSLSMAKHYNTCAHSCSSRDNDSYSRICTKCTTESWTRWKIMFFFLILQTLDIFANNVHVSATSVHMQLFHLKLQKSTTKSKRIYASCTRVTLQQAISTNSNLQFFIMFIQT